MGIVKTLMVCSDAAMSQPTRPALYKGYRFPPETAADLNRDRR